MQTEALYQALLAAFTLQRADQDDDATMARAATDILAAFAGLIADGTQAAILVEIKEIRAELAAERERERERSRFMSTPMFSKGNDSLTDLPPPSGAKQGFWRSVVGSSQPIWTETLPPARMQSPEVTASLG